MTRHSKVRRDYMRIGGLTFQPALRGMSDTTRAIQTSLDRLSSGKRVNSARDDVASFAQIQSLSAQVRGVRQANLNINSAKSMLEIIDSTLGSQLELVQRMREIALQASNGTLSSSDRGNLNRELQSLMEEFDRLALSAELNGIHVLDGSQSSLAIQLGGNADDVLNLDLTASRGVDIFRESAGDGTFATAMTNWSEAGTFSLKTAVGDVNNDGHLDLVKSNDDYIEVALGRGDGTFESGRTYSASGVSIGYEELLLEDFNSDGILDLAGINVTAEYGLIVMEGNGDGTFSAPITFAKGAGDSASQAHLEAADLDDDGDQDIVMAGGTSVHIMLNNGDGTFTFSRTLASSRVYNFTVGDFTGDGRVDIVTGAGSSVSLYQNQGNATFSSGTNLGLSNAEYIASGDIDSDGDLDLVTSDYSVEYMGAYRNNGSGSFSLATTKYFATGGNLSEQPVLADLNDDGRLDFITSIRESDLIIVMLQNGDGTFQSARTYASGGTVSDSRYVSVGDFNEDGVLDITQSIRGEYMDSILLQNTSETLSLDEVSVATQSKAQSLLRLLDSATRNLVDRKVQMASIHSRLDSALSSNLMLTENLDQAESQLKDADIAFETAELVRNQILQQSQIAVASQANLNIQIVLGLLRN